MASFIIKYWNDTKAKAVNTTVLRGSSSLTIHGLRPFTNYTVAVLVRDTKGYLTNLPDEKSTRTPIGRELPKQMRNSIIYTCMFYVMQRSILINQEQTNFINNCSCLN